MTLPVVTMQTWIDLGDGRKAPADRLTLAQWVELRRALRRYWSWVESGRRADPWQSGVASATRYDKPQTRHHKPSGGYDAGRCAEPELDADLLDWDARILALQPSDRLLTRWRNYDGLPMTTCAERLGQSVDATKQQWRRLGVRLWYRLA